MFGEKSKTLLGDKKNCLGTNKNLGGGQIENIVWGQIKNLAGTQMKNIGWGQIKNLVGTWIENIVWDYVTKNIVGG